MLFLLIGASFWYCFLDPSLTLFLFYRVSLSNVPTFFFLFRVYFTIHSTFVSNVNLKKMHILNRTKVRMQRISNFFYEKIFPRL